MANEDKSARYHRLKRRASLLSTGAGAFLLIAWLISGASSWLARISSSLVGPSPSLIVILYVVLLALVIEVVQAPIAFYQGLTLERRYGLSTQTTTRWWLDHLKAGAVALLFSVLGAVLVSFLLRTFPGAWWIAAALLFSVILVGLAQLAPVLLLPLFYEFKPLERPALRDRLLALGSRSGARILGVFEWRLGDRTRKANAALTGIGRTRRILLSDTLLAEHSDDEIEVILAHELAHHVHHDIWTSIALDSALSLAGFYLADRALTWAAPTLGLAGKSDVAGLPVILVAGALVALAFRPASNALSRAHERRADRYALEMTRNPPAFVTAMQRLGAQNLAEERPSRLVEVFFYTHPPMAARIAAARAWASTNAATA